jgi:DNA-binding helix-hairpin-helix protein with protein kinase domain
MTQVHQVPMQSRGLRAWLLWRLRRHHPAWWYRLVARAAAGHFAALIASGFLQAGIGALRDQQVIGTAVFLLYGVLPLVAALAVASYSYRTMKDPEPPVSPVSRKTWTSMAEGSAFPVAIGVIYATFLPSMFLLGFFLGLLRGIADLLFSLPTVPDTVLIVVELGLSLALSCVVAMRAYSERYRQELEVLEAAMPSGLRLAVDLHRRAEVFHAHAEVLEVAMEQAAEVSRQVQQEMMLEQQQLGELRDQALRQARLNQITPEQASALARLLDQQHAEGERRSKKVQLQIWAPLVRPRRRDPTLHSRCHARAAPTVVPPRLTS